MRLLEERGVLVISMPNKPGTLSEMSRALAKARVNIDYSYGAAPMAGGQGVFVVRVEELARAQKALAPLARRRMLKLL